MSLAKTKNGLIVHDKYNSRCTVPFAILKEAIARIEMPQKVDFIPIQVDMGRVVGKSNLVRTGVDDFILYAKRDDKSGFSPFVKNRGEVESRYVMVILKRVAPNELTLINSWIGRNAPPEPWETRAGKDSLPFWRTHAYVWGTMEVISESATTMCPW
jgi:hypothetical protein